MQEVQPAQAASIPSLFSLWAMCTEDKSYIKRIGSAHGWDILFYMFSFLKGISLFYSYCIDWYWLVFPPPSQDYHHSPPARSDSSYSEPINHLQHAARNAQTAEFERRIELETKAEKHIQKLLLLGAEESRKFQSYLENGSMMGTSLVSLTSAALF